MKTDFYRSAMAVLLFFAVVVSSPVAMADESFLWSVKGKNNTVYLLGSMHMLPPSAFPLPASMNQAYADSDIVVFETDIGSVNKPDNQKLLLKAGTLPKGESLSNVLPGEQLRDLVEIAEELRLPLEVLNGYRPWLAALTLELSAYMKQGFQPDLGVDQHYYKRALKDEKKIVTLETVRAQTNLFTDMSDAMSNDYMAMTLEHMEDPEDLPEDILEIWQDGDVGDMEDYVEDAKDDYPRMYNRFLRDRNRDWMPTVLDLLKQKENALVIVGALHMVGDEGLVELLRKSGYRPRQL
ncbi:MAG: TraB/GumN family protein [Salinisphaeraceae bacterium]|nr:TraB/GumN family protein [Salinisphaeraceae bacterium]